jgi:hypothetical protein
LAVIFRQSSEGLDFSLLQEAVLLDESEIVHFFYRVLVLFLNERDTRRANQSGVLDLAKAPVQLHSQ